jgi:hypothetical protein
VTMRVCLALLHTDRTVQPAPSEAPSLRAHARLSKLQEQPYAR